MSLLIDTCLIILLLTISVQDFKQKEISWILIPLTIIIFYVKAIQYLDNPTILGNAILNLLFVISQLILLSIYMSLKNKKLTNILKEHLGLGDVLFFMVLCLAFSPINFILFYVSSLVTTLLGFIIYKLLINKNSSKEIPLAGAMASLFILVLISNFLFFEINFYDDQPVLNLISNQ